MLDKMLKRANDREKELLMYYKGKDFASNEICKKCREHTSALSVPFGAWVVGDAFYDHEKRVLFVGKNARGTPEDNCGGFFCPYQDSRERLWHKGWPYWRYTREIVEALYGNDSIENIAFTNLIKCNDSPDKDTTTDSTKVCCILENQVISSEIALIQPTHVVFYASYYYDSFIPQIFDAFDIRKDTKIPIGKKNMLWMEADGRLQGRSMKILRTGHPERLKKIDFVDAVSGWILRNQPDGGM